MNHVTALSSMLTDGFWAVEAEGVGVTKVKMRQIHYDFLKENKETNPEYGLYLWGAKVEICNRLKNPVIFGKKKCKAIFRNSGWYLKHG
jgi:hypothetical protein